MKHHDVLIARIYLTEAEHKLEEILTRLHDCEHVRGVTVYRGIAGFGPSGKMHNAGLVDMAMNLPLVVEFFDHPDRIQATVDHICEIVEPGHVVMWPAQVMEGDA